MGAWEQKRYTGSGETSRFYRKGTTGDPNEEYPSGVRQSDVVHAAISGIQHTLVQIGHQLVADGIFGTKTDAAVRAFQKEHALTVDGVVGPATARAMFGYLLAEQEATYNIPDKLLFGKTDLESGWDPGAVGVNGWDIGIAQINLDPVVHGSAISLEWACNPVWAIPYTAERHDRAFRQAVNTLTALARDAAIGQHNSPLAVKYRLDGAVRWPQGPKPDEIARIQTNVEYVAAVRNRAARFH